MNVPQPCSEDTKEIEFWHISTGARQCRCATAFSRGTYPPKAQLTGNNLETQMIITQRLFCLSGCVGRPQPKGLLALIPSLSAPSCLQASPQPDRAGGASIYTGR